MTLTASDVARRAWAVRPSALEWCGAVAIIGLVRLVFGWPLLLLAAIAAFAISGIAVTTAVTELRVEPPQVDEPDTADTVDETAGESDVDS